MDDLPDLRPDTLPSFEFFEVPLEKVRVVKVPFKEVRVVGKVALEQLCVNIELSCRQLGGRRLGGLRSVFDCVLLTTK